MKPSVHDGLLGDTRGRDGEFRRNMLPSMQRRRRARSCGLAFGRFSRYEAELWRQSRSDCLVLNSITRLTLRRGYASQIFAVGNSAKVRARPLAVLYAANLTAAYDWQPVNARGLALT